MNFFSRKIKLVLSAVLLFTLPIFVYSKDYSYYNEAPLTFAQSFRKNFFLTGGLCTVISIGQKSYTPVLFSVGGGYSFKIKNNFYLDTRISFYSNYYLWDESLQAALPSEVENRTSTSINIALDLPFVASFNFGKHTLRAGGGLGLIPKINFLSSGVSTNDEGSSGSAGEDLNLINKYLWSYARWIYPQIALSYSALLTNGWRAGLDFKYYLPLTSLIKGRGLNDSVIQLCLRLALSE